MGLSATSDQINVRDWSDDQPHTLITKTVKVMKQ